jgi:hypothetical protein
MLFLPAHHIILNITEVLVSSFLWLPTLCANYPVSYMTKERRPSSEWQSMILYFLVLLLLMVVLGFELRVSGLIDRCSTT